MQTSCIYLQHLCLFLLLQAFTCQAQDSTIKIRAKRPPFRIIDATLDFYTTLNGNRSINTQDEQLKDNVYLYYNFTIQNRLKIKKLKITNYFFTELGVRNYRDSIVVIAEDVYNFKNSISLPLQKSRFALNLTISSKSQFWKHYNYLPDSNNKYIKNLYTDYLSPGYTIYSGGLRYNFWDRSSFEVGLASGKTTRIRNQDIFLHRKASRLYGLNQGEQKKTVLGIHVLLNISTKKLCKNLYLEQFSQVFLDKDSLQKIKSYTADINNAFHYLFLRYVRLSLRTKFLYDRSVSEKPSLIQQVSIGFYLNNKLH